MVDLILGFILGIVILSLIEGFKIFYKARENRKSYSVFVNNEFKEQILYGEKDTYVNRVKYRSTLKISVDKKKKKIDILVDYI